ncbi:MAG TPA: class II glutamine amidotransferase [Thermoplasmata archaeon]|nr:class II glutamine amidotransferase [Thermoplasmata archaeon]
MCRLFGQLTNQPASAEEWLLRADRSLLAQSNASPETAQTDGWGIGWFDGEPRARIEKGVGGAFAPGERERFTAAATAAHGPLIVGHLRHASNPMDLPHERLLAPENSQPFGSHTMLFAHNGAIPFPVETRPFLGLLEPKVRGVNDSEVLCWLLERNVEETHDVAGAYARTVEDLVRVWQAVGRPAIPPFSGLNVVYARSPDELFAFCLWTGDHGAGLLDPHRRYYEMTYRAEPHRVIVGSEPFDDEKGRWTSLRSGQYLRAWRNGGRLDWKVAAIPLPTHLALAPPPT